MATERLQKILARAGISSRRHAEQLILAGRVRVNGQVVTELGARADAFDDKVEVDGKRAVAESPVYVLLHKPRAVVSTVSDPEGRATVTSMVSGIDARLFPVGRLDFQTSGALLLTNDGEFAAALLHPGRHVPKRYLAKLEGMMTEQDLQRWRTGVVLDDGHKTLPAEVKAVRAEDGKTWLEIVLHEGKNQQIRRMGQATGFEVLRLTRLAFANVSIEGLRAGGWRLLTVDELRDLREAYGVPRRVRSAVTNQADLPTRSPSRGQQARRGGLPDTHARVRGRSTGPRVDQDQPQDRPGPGPRARDRKPEQPRERKTEQPRQRARKPAQAVGQQREQTEQPRGQQRDRKPAQPRDQQRAQKTEQPRGQQRDRKPAQPRGQQRDRKKGPARRK